jgi:predicted AlkP superfamily pyrophosphatase or phosphodiesterase
MTRNRLVPVAALLALLFLVRGYSASSAQPAAPQAGTTPTLVVLIAVDQLRGDYLSEYGGNFTAGLKRLMREGAWFTRAAYPYLNTVTCAGHATIGTGSFPYRHGMILNGWLDRETNTVPFCTQDPSETLVSYNGLAQAPGDSAKKLLRPTLGQQIHDRGGRSVSMSLKPRSAIPVAGRKADVVVWFDSRGGWATSTAYAPAPVPFLKQFIDANPLAADVDKTWDRSLGPSAYKYDDDSDGEGRPSGWTRTFPHKLGSDNGGPDAGYYSRWQMSPFADEYLGRMAMASIDALGLGRGKSVDFLGISFSSLDSVGHAFGPRSHEVQDMLVRLDRTIGRLLDHLDATVGAGRYVVGFSSDHGVAEVPDQTPNGGRQSSREATTALQKVLEPALGPGQHAVVVYTEVYLSRAAAALLKRDGRIRAAAVNALASLPAVERVLFADEVASSSARSSSDPVVRAAALSYYEDRSGDLIIVPKPQWLLSTSITTHGTHHWYDQHVPVILFGAAVRPGEYPGGATPADLVPSLAAVAGVKIDRVDGRALTEALQVHAAR